MAKKHIKIGVRQGSGPEPGYEWNVGILDVGFDEVIGFLNKPEYEHIAMQVKELAREQDPSHPATVSVDKIGTFYELREKGGFGNKNVRVFFGIDKPKRSIVILGGIKMENNGPTPEGTRIAMSRRWRKYSNGDFGEFTP